MLDFILENKQIMLADAVNDYNEKQGVDKRIKPDDIIFDDSRAWSLSIRGDLMDLSCNRFGAYRNYLGGGVRGSIEHNGRDEENTTKLGEMFADALKEIESAYNEDYSPDASESWELATGVLLK